MISDKDVAKIRKAIKPDFDSVEQKVRKALQPDFDRMATKSDLDDLEKKIDKNFDEKLAAQSSEIKQYIHEGVNAVVKGVDNLLTEYQFDSRIRKLEKIHPSGRHRSLN